MFLAETLQNRVLSISRVITYWFCQAFHMNLRSHSLFSKILTKIEPNIQNKFNLMKKLSFFEKKCVMKSQISLWQLNGFARIWFLAVAHTAVNGLYHFFCVESNTNNALETAAENVKRNSQKVISKTANQKPS